MWQQQALAWGIYNTEHIVWCASAGRGWARAPGAPGHLWLIGREGGEVARVARVAPGSAVTRGQLDSQLCPGYQ